LAVELNLVRTGRANHIEDGLERGLLQVVAGNATAGNGSIVPQLNLQRANPSADTLGDPFFDVSFEFRRLRPAI
jgi:hypothetical protein